MCDHTYIHRALLVVGDIVEESYIYLSRQVIKKLQVVYSGDICRGDLSQLSFICFEVD